MITITKRARNHRINLLFLLLCFPVFVHAQENTVVGDWLLDVDKSIELMSRATRTRYDSLDIKRKEQVKAAMGSRIFRFQEKGKVVVVWKAGSQQRESSGEWAYGSKLGTLRVTIDSKAQMFDYSFSEGVLTLKSHDSTGFFSTLCFTHQ